MTKQQALALSPGQIIYHVSGRNADGTSTRARVNGRAVTFKRPQNQHRWRVPLKHGFYTTFQLTIYNVHDWTLIPKYK